MLDHGTPLAGKGYQEIPAGRRLIVLTPGGGGYGDPSERDPQTIAIDRRDGLIDANGAPRHGSPTRGCEMIPPIY